MSLLIRLLLFTGGLAASLFIASDIPQYPVMQVLFGIIILTGLISVVAFWPEIKNWFSAKKQK